jgi:hypothetical protein
MFRTMFSRYIDEEADGKADIGHTDDFICQECTRWSGLGVIDILAGTLDISDDDRRDLRGGTSGLRRLTVPCENSMMNVVTYPKLLA